MKRLALSHLLASYLTLLAMIIANDGISGFTRMDFDGSLILISAPVSVLLMIPVAFEDIQDTPHPQPVLFINVFGYPAALAILLLVTRKLRPKPIRPGYCPHCGYDLRATPDRCPECGNAPVRDKL